MPPLAGARRAGLGAQEDNDWGPLCKARPSPFSPLQSSAPDTAPARVQNQAARPLPGGDDRALNTGTPTTDPCESQVRVPVSCQKKPPKAIASQPVSGSAYWKVILTPSVKLDV